MANTVLESATVNNDVAAVMYNVTCSTAAATAAKTATASTKFALFAGVRVRVTFTNGNTANNPTLNINSSVDVPLKADNGNAVASMNAGTVLDIIYDGTNYLVSNIGTIPPVVKTWAEDKFALKTDALTGVTATSPLSASTSSGVATVSHDDSGVTAGSKGDTTSQTPQFGGTFKALSGTVDVKGHLTAFGEHTVTIPSSTATQSASGLMSSSDKTKLDGIADGADAVAFTQTQTSGTEIGTLTINSDATKLYAPVQTDISGNAGTATTLQTARTIDGALFNGSADVVHYGFCTTSGLNLTVDIPSFTGTTLVEGARIVVRFQNASNSSGPSLNVSNTGAHNIALNTMPGTFTPPGNDYWSAGAVLEFVYTNGYWVITNGEKASTTTCGLVKLSTATNSASNSLAATPSAVKSAYDLANSKPNLIPTTGAVPLMDGTASVGSSTTAARSDHVHPTDTSRVTIDNKNKNLLDNWYFLGGGSQAGYGAFPINQQGENFNDQAKITTYQSSVGALGIDRWRLYGEVRVSADWGYFFIAGSYTWQEFPNSLKNELDGKRIAVSAVSADKTAALSGSIIYQKAPSANVVIVNESLMTILLGTDGNIYFVSNTQTGWAAFKVEVGDTQTLYAYDAGTGKYILLDEPPNYELERLKCQQYYEAINCVGVGTVTNDGRMFVPVWYRADKPLPNLTTYGVTCTFAQYHDGSNWVNLNSGVVASSDAPGCATVGLSGSNLVVGGNYTIRFRLIAGL